MNLYKFIRTETLSDNLNFVTDKTRLIVRKYEHSQHPIRCFIIRTIANKPNVTRPKSYRTIRLFCTGMQCVKSNL